MAFTSGPLTIASGRLGATRVSRSVCQSANLRWAIEQRCFLVFHRHRHDRIPQLSVCPPAADYSDVVKVPALVGFQRLDFLTVVGSDRPVPVEPPLPTIRHRVSHFDVHDVSLLPVPPPPRRGMETPPLVLGPPRAKMLGNAGAFDVLHYA